MTVCHSCAVRYHGLLKAYTMILLRACRNYISLRLVGVWRVDYSGYILRAQKRREEAKWALSLVPPTVPYGPRLQDDFTLVECLFMAVDELDREIALEYINVGGHWMNHPA